MGLGATLRWFLTGRLNIYWDFAHLRHAHSHLGYYGALFPLCWLAWSSVGAPTPGRTMAAIYGGATALAFFGFIRVGYGPEAIVGSAVIGIIWVISAWPLRRRMADWRDPLGAVLPGVLLAEACIPPIALFLHRDPALSHAFVVTFLAGLLFVVALPSALAALKLATPWPLLLIFGGLGAAAFGVWPSPLARAGLAALGGLLCWRLLASRAPLHLRGVWLAVGLGLLTMAAGLLPDRHPVVIGAIHFLILSPVLGTFALIWRPQLAPPWAWWLYHGAVGLLCAPLVLRGFGADVWTLFISAAGGLGVLCWWVWVLVPRLSPRRGPTAKTR